MNVHHLVTTYGYWAVFALVAAESLGIPLPGETIVIAAGTYAGHTHRLSVWAIWLVAALAGSAGGLIGFLVGQWGGYRLVRRYGHHIRIDESKIKVGRYVFDRYGWTVVLFGRFVSILRTYTAFLAGTSRMRFRTFVFFNALGALAWSAVYSFGAYAIGNS